MNKTAFCRFLSLGLVISVGFVGVESVFAAVPAGFTQTTLTNALNQPIAMAFAPDGRIFVTEKIGKVRIIKDGTLLSTPFLQIPVNSVSERGLLGIALDPDFADNSHVYVYYSRTNEPIKNRVSRFTASSTNPDVADAGSEVILIDNISGEHGWHNGGAVHFGLDGKLYITTGDATQTRNAQDLMSLNGKVLRINRDGTVPDDNPFATTSTTTNPRIYAWGLRNPFTFAVDPVDGKIFVNDVGEGSWEEINEVAKGANFGWPTCEGTCTNPQMTNPFYPISHNVGKSITGAAFYYGNQFPAGYYGRFFFGDYVNGYIKALDPATKTATDFATGLNGPVGIEVGDEGSLYYVSVNQGSLFKISYGTTTSTTTPPPPPPSPTPTSTPPVASSTIKIFAAGTQANGQYPTLDLRINNLTVKTFTNIQGNPDARQFQELSYTSQSTTTPSQIKLVFTNDFYGDSGQDRNLRVDRINIDGIDYQTEAFSTLSTGTWTPSTDCAPGNKQSEWLHCNGYFAFSGNAPAQNQAPQAIIELPVENATYVAGDTISYTGSGTDPEDGSLPYHNFTWTISFHHDDHTHPFLGPIPRIKGGEFQVPSHGESSANVWYRIHLIVRDSQGLEHMTYRDIFPQRTEVTITTNPTGLQLELDGQPKTAPYTFTGVVGVVRNLFAPSTQSLDGKTYEFVSWSDGEGQSHDIITPAATTTYTVLFKEAGATSTPPTASSTIKIFAAGQPADGVYPTLDLFIGGQLAKSFADIRGNAGSGTFQELTFESSTPITSSQVRIAFTNDYYDPGRNQDRNVRIDKINIDGTNYETEASSTNSTGTWTPSTDCAPGNKQSEWLHCGGHFQY